MNIYYEYIIKKNNKNHFYLCQIIFILIFVFHALLILLEHWQNITSLVFDMASEIEWVLKISSVFGTFPVRNPVKYCRVSVLINILTNILIIVE